MLWQLKKLSTGEPLNEPQKLPENWGPIFGLLGFKDKLGDLSWVGLHDQGWFETDLPDPEDDPVVKARQVLDRAKELLAESDWAALPDVPMTVGEKEQWYTYRQALRDIDIQPSFPEVTWPVKPV